MSGVVKTLGFSQVENVGKTLKMHREVVKGEAG